MAVMDVGNQFSNEVESWKGDVDFSLFFMIFVPEGDDIVGERGDPGLGDGWV